MNYVNGDSWRGENSKNVDVAELVDAMNLKFIAFGRAGSIPAIHTRFVCVKRFRNSYCRECPTL